MHKQGGGLNINAFCLGLYLWEEVFYSFRLKVEGLYHVAGGVTNSFLPQLPQLPQLPPALLWSVP